MKSEDFKKMDEMFMKSSQKNHQAPAHDFFSHEPNSIPEPNPVDISKQNAFPSGSNAFKALKDEKNKKYKNQTKTKWDTFQPYAFSKLSQSQKAQHFLQLFDDYLAVKIKLNEEGQKSKKLIGKTTFLQSQVYRLKGINGQNSHKVKKGSQEINQNTQLKEQVKRLHQKIIALTSNKNKITTAHNRPHSAAKTQKSIFPSTENIKAELQFEKKQVRELLMMIDELKSQKFSLESQLKEKQSKQGFTKTYNPIQNSKVNNQSQFQAYSYDLEKWKQKYNDLQLCFNKMSEDKDRRIKQLQIENISLKQNERAQSKNVDFGKLSQINSSHLQQKITDLERQKQSLQRQVRRMVSLPFNQSNNSGKNQFQLQQKCSKMQLALQKMKDQLTKTKELSSKYFADLQYKTREVGLLKAQNEKFKKQLKELIQKQTSVKSSSTEIDYDDYYRKLLGIVKLEGDDPIWRKYSNIASPSFSSMTENMLKKFAEQAWVSKLELLAHLEKAQIELRAMRESTQSRIGLYLKDKQHLQQELRLVRARLDQWVSMENVGKRRDVQLHQSFGISYDDSISVFQSDEQQLKELQGQQNYFDLYLGQLVLDQNGLLRNPQNKLKQITQMISFLTVDFYNHDTQHSNFVEGNSKKLANNYSFKVQMSQTFVKYITKQSVMLELWSPQGSSTVLLGKGQIWLRDLVANAVKDVSAVVGGKCPFYNQMDKSLVATLEYRIRMRLPIGSYCQWNSQENKGVKAISMFRLGQRKRLEIRIIKASDLPSSSSHFIYFTLQGDDYYTQPARGSSPEWNYRKQVELMVDQEFQQELKQKYLQFTVFDDQRPVNEDVVGIAKADLTKLIDSVEQLKLDLQVKDTSFRTIGKLKIQLKWL